MEECYRVLKKNGILLAGFDNGINYLFDDDEVTIKYKLPFNPLDDMKLYEDSIRMAGGFNFPFHRRTIGVNCSSLF
jgi:hypothetical protein